MDKIRPVSYTHLDVYKRQLIESLGWWNLDRDATLVNGPMKAKGKDYSSIF